MPTKKKILIFQDRNEESFSLKNLLSTSERDILVITSPEIVAEQVNNENISLLIINEAPANMNVIDFCNEIRGSAHSSNTSILILCNNSDIPTLSSEAHKELFDCYLAKPYKESDLLSYVTELLINQVSSANTTSQRDSKKKVIALTSGKGGTGITTICANWAVSLAKDYNNKVLLIDAGSYTNQLSHLLNSEPKKNLADVCYEHVQVTEENIKEAITQISPNLYIANLLNRIKDIDNLRLSTLESLIDVAYSEYDYILIDTQSGILNPITNSLISRCDDLHVITTFEPLAMKEANSYVNVLKDFGITPGKIKLIMNRADSEIGKSNIQEIKKYLFYDIFCTLPNDWKSCIEAASKKIPVIEYAPKSKFSQELKVLSQYYLKINNVETIKT